MLNSSQAEALFAYSKQQGYTAATTLYGFELGEELYFEVGTPAFRHYTEGYRTCANILRTVWGDTSERPNLMGPCPGMMW